MRAKTAPSRVPESGKKRSLQPGENRPTGKLSGQTIFLGVALAIACAVFGYMALSGNGESSPSAAAASGFRLKDIPFDGARAYEYLKDLCEIGRRPSGSPGMEAQQKLLAEHFEKLGGKVEFQRFTGHHPVDGTDVPMANLIVHWHPESTERILLCTHYDTLPYPMKDPHNPKGKFVGANDGTSGVAIFMELAHEMSELDCKYGIDFVLFDAEEFIFDKDHPYFLGSGEFARQYVEKPPAHRYRWGVLLDMVGDADLEIFQERNSMSWPDTRPLVKDIWETAARLGVREFVASQKYNVLDDHLPLHEAKIPTCDVIDFDYPSWHTQGDTPQRCSPLSLAKVGWVIREWLSTVE